jgi:hypothetical protein
VLAVERAAAIGGFQLGSSVLRDVGDGVGREI